MNTNVCDTTKTIHFMWDLDQNTFKDMLAPLPDHPLDVCDYMGAVFFGKFKLEFIRNDIAGVYCNLFEYGAEDDPGHAYAYLEDGTPYEERFPIGDEIVSPDDMTFDEFTNDIERQIIQLLDKYPEFKSSAAHKTEPTKWYPCNHPYHVRITKETKGESL